MDDTDAQARDPWPELERIAQPARERRRLPPEVRGAIIAELCAVSPLSVKELSTLLDRSEAYIGDAIRPLVTAGNLTFLYPDQPRHPKQKYIAGKATAVAVPPPVAAVRPSEAVRFEPPPPKIGTPAFEAGPIGSRYVARSEVQVSIAHAQAQRDTEKPDVEVVEEEPAANALPNQWTNAVIVIVVGLALSQWHTALWPFIAVASGAALAFVHVLSNSNQYRRFRELHQDGSQGRIFFVLLKGGVAVVEIALVYFAAGAISSAS